MFKLQNTWVVNEYPFVLPVFGSRSLAIAQNGPKGQNINESKALIKREICQVLVKREICHEVKFEKPKGNRHSLEKGAAGSKQHRKKPATKKSLNKNDFAKLGNMTLAEKIEKAAETANSRAEAVKGLKNMMNKQAHSQAWPKHTIHVRGKIKT